jgi:hypothetical protein
MKASETVIRMAITKEKSSKAADGRERRRKRGKLKVFAIESAKFLCFRRSKKENEIEFVGASRFSSFVCFTEEKDEKKKTC